VYKRCTKIVDLINKIFLNYFRVPDGYYRCPECVSQYPLRQEKRSSFINFLEHQGENTCCFMICNICEGTGYIDFVANATKPWKNEELPVAKHRIIGFIPFSILDSEDLEIASSVFYNTYDKHDYLGFDIDFKNPKLKEKSTKVQTQFIRQYFDYKKSRDKRTKFLVNNFYEFQKTIINKTKISSFPKGKIKCEMCNAKPIDIQYLAFNATLRIKICGNCYGRGYQDKRDTKAVKNFYICYASKADYSNKKRMIKGLLTDIDLHRTNMILNLDKIENI